MRILTITLVTILIITQSCFTTHDRIKRSYTELNAQTIVNQPQPVVLYFENETVNFEYQKLGLVEVQGAQYSNTNDNLNHLKYEAWKNGSNAIINVKNYTKIVQVKASNSSTVTPTFYNATVTNGIAVRINDSLYKQMVTNKADTLFISKIKSSDKSEANGFIARLVFGTLCVIACIIVGIYYIANPK